MRPELFQIIKRVSFKILLMIYTSSNLQVRYSHDKLFQDQENKVGTTLNLKLKKAAKERERKEQELKAKLEERNKKAEMVRQNKEKLQMDMGPESA